MKRFSGTAIASICFVIALAVSHGLNIGMFFEDVNPVVLDEIRTPLSAHGSDASGVALREVIEAPRAVSNKVPDHRRRLRAFFGRSDGDWDVHVFVEQAAPAKTFRVDLPFRVARIPEELRFEDEHVLRIPIEDAYGIPVSITLDLDTLVIAPAELGTHRDHASHETP